MIPRRSAQPRAAGAVPPEPDALATLHAACFVRPRPWTASEFGSILRTRGTVLRVADAGGVLAGFGLARVAGDEAELLTLAVDAAQRRQGMGRALLQELMSACKTSGAVQIFLEVVADNTAACALYAGEGFERLGLRRGYLRDENGASIDAFVMGCKLGCRSGCDPG